MRILSLILLCFSLAFANVSYAQSHNVDCPMAQGISMATMDYADMPDCCNDAETAAKSGESCKAEQGCSIPNLIIFPSIPSWNFVSAGMSSTLTNIPFEPNLAPNDLWRPPTLSWSCYFRSVSSYDFVLCLKHLRCMWCNVNDFFGSSSCQTNLSEPLCSKDIRHNNGEFIGHTLLHYWLPVLHLQ